MSTTSTSEKHFQALLTPPDTLTERDFSPSPPQSQSQSPAPSTVISVSTTFFPNAPIFPGGQSRDADVLLLTLDSVFFYVHRAVLVRESANHFNGLLKLPPLEDDDDNTSSPTMLDLPLQSAVLNILLHLVYSVPCDRYNPSLDTISAVFPALKVYGYSAQSMIPPHPDFSQVMIFHAPGDPLRVYALAASASLEALAVAASHFTLVTSLSSVTDALAAQMGPHYLRRLFFLHLGRVEALKLHLMSPPDMHESTPDCDFTEQKKLTRAWALATAYLAWDGRPDASPASLSASLTPLVEHLQCRPCRDLLQGRILTLIQNWSLVKTTI